MTWALAAVFLAGVALGIFLGVAIAVREQRQELLERAERIRRYGPWGGLGRC